MVSAAATATALPAHVWEWEDDHEGSGHWKPFDPASAAALAAARSAGASNLVLNVHGFAYDIDLTAMRQKNVYRRGSGGGTQVLDPC